MRDHHDSLDAASRGLLVGCFVAAWLVSACSSIPIRVADSRALGHDAVTGVVDAVDDPENAERIRRLATDPDVAQAVSDLTHAATEGAFAGLTDEELFEALTARTEHLTRTLIAALSDEMRTDLGPTVRETLHLAVRDAVRQLMGPDARARLEETGGALAGAATRAAFDEMGQGIDQDLAGPVERLVRGTVRGAVEEATASREPIGDLAAYVAERAAQGAGDGLGRSLREGPLHDALSRFSGETRDNVKDVLVFMSIAGSILLTIAVMAWLQNRRRAERTEQALRLVTSTIKRHADRDDTRELVRAIKEAGRDEHPGGPPLREFLERNADLRVRD